MEKINMSGWEKIERKIFLLALTVFFAFLTIPCVEAANRPGDYYGGAPDPRGGYWQQQPPGGYYEDPRTGYVPQEGQYVDPYSPQPSRRQPSRTPPASAAPTPNPNVQVKPTGKLKNHQPVLSGFEFSQAGDVDLVMRVSGRGLPAPEVAHFDNKTIVVFREVYGRNINPAHRAEGVPMIMAVRTELIDQDVRITITTDVPLQLRSARGSPPSDSYTLMLTTAQQYAKAVNEPVATHQPKTPKIPTVPLPLRLPLRWTSGKRL